MLVYQVSHPHEIFGGKPGEAPTGGVHVPRTPGRGLGQRVRRHNGGVHASKPRPVVVLGSTGSVGTQALDVIAANPDDFTVVALAAGGAKPGLLAEQAARFGAEAVAVADPAAVPDLRRSSRPVA